MYVKVDPDLDLSEIGNERVWHYNKMLEAFKFASQTQANTTTFTQNMNGTPHNRTCRNVPQQIQTNIIWDSKQNLRSI